MFENLDLSEMRREVAKLQQKRQKNTTWQFKQLVAPAVMRRCLAGRPFSASDIWTGVPELRQSHQTANAIGTMLGQGINGKGGFSKNALAY